MWVCFYAPFSYPFFLEITKSPKFDVFPLDLDTDTEMKFFSYRGKSVRHYSFLKTVAPWKGRESHSSPRRRSLRVRAQFRDIKLGSIISEIIRPAGTSKDHWGDFIADGDGGIKEALPAACSFLCRSFQHCFRTFLRYHPSFDLQLCSEYPVFHAEWGGLLQSKKPVQ